MPTNNKPRRTKKQAAAIKLQAAAARERKAQLKEKWALLRRIGAYNTKETAALNRLTKHRMAEIEKRFKEIQKMKKLVRGKTVRPITEKVVMTKSGKTKLVYDFSPQFTFVKTKNKTDVIEGVRKTGKGYIVEKSGNVDSIKIARNGEIIEKKGGMTRRRRKYRGRDLIALVKAIDDGAFKFRKNDLMVFHRWGQPNSVWTAVADGAKELSRYVSEMARTMDASTYERFVDASYVEFIEYIDVEDGE